MQSFKMKKNIHITIIMNYKKQIINQNKATNQLYKTYKNTKGKKLKRTQNNHNKKYDKHKT